MRVQENADFPSFWSHVKWSGRRESHKTTCILKSIQSLLGQEYKREFSEETGRCRKPIYSERGIPESTLKKEVEGWRVNAGSEVQCSNETRLSDLPFVWNPRISGLTSMIVNN